jgi:hypothetical protein
VPRLLFTEHRQAHAASAFFPSPFDRAAVLCMDGVGEWATTTLWLGEGNELSPVWQIDFPHSLGLLYSAARHPYRARLAESAGPFGPRDLIQLSFSRGFTFLRYAGCSRKCSTHASHWYYRLYILQPQPVDGVSQVKPVVVKFCTGCAEPFSFVLVVQQTPRHRNEVLGIVGRNQGNRCILNPN